MRSGLEIELAVEHQPHVVEFNMAPPRSPKEVGVCVPGDFHAKHVEPQAEPKILEQIVFEGDVRIDEEALEA